MRVSPTAVPSEFDQVRELTALIGNDRSLTQASTGNSSAKFNGELWVKRSGCWMSAAIRDDIFIRLNLDDVGDCLRRNLDPSDLFAGASLETAMHAVMPHRIVMHVHSVNAIAWAPARRAFADSGPACGPSLAVDSISALGSAPRDGNRTGIEEAPRYRSLYSRQSRACGWRRRCTLCPCIAFRCARAARYSPPRSAFGRSRDSGQAGWRFNLALAGR
jgi:hypothetical protein